MACWLPCVSSSPLLWFQGQNRRGSRWAKAGKPLNRRYLVTYYYTSYRCPTCKKLETYSRQAIEEGFPAELEEKRIVFRTLNLDEPENSRYVEDYKLVTKSLIISLNRNGKEIKWKNLPDIWKLVGDQEKFGEYVQRETRGFLEEL